MIVSEDWHVTTSAPCLCSLSPSAALVAKVGFPKRLQQFMLSVQVTMAICGIPPASYVPSVARHWWTWSTSGPIRSCSVEDIIARRSGPDAQAVMRWDDITVTQNNAEHKTVHLNQKYIFFILPVVFFFICLDGMFSADGSFSIQYRLAHSIILTLKTI